MINHEINGIKLMQKKKIGGKKRKAHVISAVAMQMNYSDLLSNKKVIFSNEKYK